MARTCCSWRAQHQQFALCNLSPEQHLDTNHPKVVCGLLICLFIQRACWSLTVVIKLLPFNLISNDNGPVAFANPFTYLIFHPGIKKKIIPSLK